MNPRRRRVARWRRRQRIAVEIIRRYLKRNPWAKSHAHRIRYYPEVGVYFIKEYR